MFAEAPLSACWETDKYWLTLDRTQGLHCLLYWVVVIRVTELIESEKKKKQLPKTLLEKGREGKEKKKNSLEQREAAVASTRREWQECGCQREGWKTAPPERGEAAAASCAGEDGDEQGPQRQLSTCQLCCFSQLARILRLGCTDYMTPRGAFGVDKRQSAGSHYPGRIDFSFVFPSG